MNVSKLGFQNLSRVVLVFAVWLLTFTAAFALTDEQQHVSAPNNPGETLFQPSATFDKIWVDYDVTESNEKGMRIHVKFTAYGMKNLDSYLAIYFETDKGVRLKDKNDKYNSSSDEVAAYRSLKPAYDPAVYEDHSVFMPYSELDLDAGNWDLRMDVDLIYKEGGLIQHLTYKDFNYKKGDDVDKSSIAPTFKRVWIDQNITEGGRKGMRIHVNFEVVGLKGVDSKLVARVQKDDGDYLPSSSSYSNDEGELETSYSIKPGFETTVYEDATMFLPYSEINLRKGVWNLKLDIDLSYENGELIQHLAYKEFEFNSTVTVNETPTKNGINATAKRIWVEQNITQSGKRGMLIHVNFEVVGLKFVDSKLTVRVRKEDEYLASSSLFSNDNGELEISYPLKPALATTVYNDVTMFLPYSEIILRKGVWNLKLDVDVNYSDGELIQHLDFYEFEFTK